MSKKKQIKKIPAKQPATPKRKRGENKLTKEIKAILFTTLKADYEKLDKWMNCCDFRERAKLLKDFAKYLGDEAGFKEKLWEQLEPHYKKLQFYIPHLTAREKISLLRGFLSDIAPEQRRDAIEHIKRQNLKF